MGHLSDYEVGSMVSKTKFSEVFKARRIADNTLVALKKIEIFEIMEQEKRQKILREAELIQSLNHPNIIKCIEHFIEDNVFILIFEWAALGDIKRLVKKAAQTNTHLEERVIWNYAYQISDALAYMHEQRVMHRDIKPANIFIAGDGSLRIGDLGLGREFSSKTMEAFSKVGTPLYMSPEVIHGDGYDFRSDVWSLGCLIYELTTLRSPFRAEGTNIYGIFKKIKNGEYKPIGDGYSPEIRNVVHRMLSLDPTKRPTMPEVRAYAKRQCEVYKQIQSQVSPLIVMDNVVEKLKLIDYEKEFLSKFKLTPYSRTEFAIAPPKVDGSDARVFHRFISLVTWLVTLNDVKVQMPSPEDDPAVLTTDILVHLKALGLNTNFPPAKFQRGYGDVPCVVLNHLLNLVLKRREFAFQQPAFDSKGKASKSGDDGVGVEVDEGDASLDNFVPDDTTAVTDQSRVSADEKSRKKEQKMTEKQAAKHRKEWKAEVERVSAEVKVKGGGASALHDQWQKRLDTLVAARDDLQALTPNTCRGFKDLARDGVEQQKKLASREDMLNRELHGTIGEYARICRELAEFVDANKVSLEKVTALSAELANVSEEVEMVKDKIDSHGHGAGSDEPLIRIRTAVKRVKKDIKELDVRLYLIQQRLWSAKTGEYARTKALHTAALANVDPSMSLNASMSLSSSQPLRGIKVNRHR